MAKDKTMQVHQMTIAQFEAQFQDEDDCKSYLANNRWPTQVACPRCGSLDITEHGSKEWHWQCYDCSPNGVGYRFSVTVGTIFENTNKPLRQWFRVMHMMLTSKKGISALQIYRVLGFGSYSTALNMCNKIRIALGNTEFQKLVGVVEVDETFVGGKAKNKHKDQRGDRNGTGGGGPRGGVGSGKAVIAGAVARKGNVIARVVENVDADSLIGFIRESVAHNVSLICTDAWRSYKPLKRVYPAGVHGVVDHRAGQYVLGAIHTNTIEGFWSMVKRGIMGTFHKVSHKYLPLYVNEFEFRYNNRMSADIFQTAIRSC